MLRRDESYTSIVSATLANTSIAARLQREQAVVLERMARGGGATRWYYCRDQSCLGAIEGLLSPGAAVSFYFDNRIRHSRYSQELEDRLGDAIRDVGEMVLG